MHNGRYVAVIEYDFAWNEKAPNARPVEHVQGFFRSGEIEKEIRRMLCTEIFDPEMGNCEVTQTFFDMREVPKEDD